MVIEFIYFLPTAQIKIFGLESSRGYDVPRNPKITLLLILYSEVNEYRFTADYYTTNNSKTVYCTKIEK